MKEFFTRSVWGVIEGHEAEKGEEDLWTNIDKIIEYLEKNPDRKVKGGENERERLIELLKLDSKTYQSKYQVPERLPSISTFIPRDKYSYVVTVDFTEEIVEFETGRMLDLFC